MDTQEPLIPEAENLSVEAQLELKRKQVMRNAYIAAAAVMIALLVLSAFVVALRIFEEPTAEFVSEPPPRPRLEPRKLEMKVRVNQLTKRSSRPKLQPRMMVNAPSDLALPEIKKNPKAVKKTVKRNFSTLGLAGVGMGVGGGTGDGMGGGGLGIGLPEIMSDRCSAKDRSARRRKNGGRAASERAVVRSLDWLQAAQNSDGSWGAKHKIGMTGLALLAYLGHCETPQSVHYGKTVRKGIDYLLSQGSGGIMGTDGGHGKVYEHGIAIYALGEAFIMTGEQKIKEVFTSGIETIMAGQAGDGGWHYGFSKKTPSDTSVSGWQIQALKSAYLSGLEFDGLENVLDRAMANLKRVHSPETGTFGYRDAGDNTGNKGNLTGMGVLGLAMWKNGRSDQAKDGLEYVLKITEGESRKDQEMKYSKMNIYRAYYDVQATFAAGGRTWRTYNKWFQKSLTEAQESNGYYPPTGTKGIQGGEDSTPDGQVYRVAMNTLMLEVYYRYLPTVDM